MIVPLLTRIIWYVAADAVRGVNCDPAELTRVWRTTNEQDIGLCERTQAGVTPRRFEPGPLHTTRESAVRSALDTYLELMARDD